MSEGNKITEENLENFCSVTGATKERARFYLEASNGDIEAAIGNFFEGAGNEDESQPNTGGGGGASLRPTRIDDDDDDDDDEDYNPRRAGREEASAASFRPRETKRQTAARKPEPGKIFTLRDAADDEEGEEDDEKGQAFYAGGSETSGQQILGPSKKNPEHIIKDLFKNAKEHGAQEVDSNDQQQQRRGPVVYGTGYRLGTGEEPSEVIRGPPRPKTPKVHKLKLWKNGFTVDDGALRTYSDPANQDFLAAIKKGEPPRELIRQSEGAEVNLDMEDHRDEDYAPPKGKYVLFNDGYKLGSPTPTVVSNASPQEQGNNEELAKRELALDESKPVTQIQIRLSNGSRLVIKANQTHKVKDIRRYINRARPEYNNRPYSLLMSFPNKEITNEDQTLSEANLLNSNIIQKL